MEDLLNITIDAVKFRIDKAKETIESNLASFKSAFIAEFPNDLANQEEYKAFTLAFFLPAILSHTYSNNSAAIMECFSLLERLSIERFPMLISSKKINQRTLTKLIERKNLNDIAILFQIKGIIDSKDVKFIEELTKLRNGVAHKNTKPIENLLNSGNPIRYGDIEKYINNSKTVNVILKSIRILHKILDHQYLLSKHKG